MYVNTIMPQPLENILLFCEACKLIFHRLLIKYLIKFRTKLFPVYVSYKKDTNNIYQNSYSIYNLSVNSRYLCIVAVVYMYTYNTMYVQYTTKHIYEIIGGGVDWT